MKHLFQILAVFLFIAFSFQLKAQKGYDFPDSVKYKKNIIKWNITPFLIWGINNINISYERVVKPYQSFSVNAGTFILPQFTKSLFDSLEIKNSTQRSGFTVSGDYRFYFKKRNKRMAPDGLYWGPYGSYHFTQFKNDITIINNPNVQGDLLFGAQLNIFSAGVQIGYQFIIKERLAIDLIFMGPSLSMYTTKLSLGGAVNADPDDEYLQAVYDVLKNTIPGFDKLIQDGEVTSSGTNFSLGFGLRYMIQVGYRF